MNYITIGVYLRVRTRIDVLRARHSDKVIKCINIILGSVKKKPFICDFDKILHSAIFSSVFIKIIKIRYNAKIVLRIIIFQSLILVKEITYSVNIKISSMYVHQ